MAGRQCLRHVRCRNAAAGGVSHFGLGTGLRDLSGHLVVGEMASRSLGYWRTGDLCIVHCGLFPRGLYLAATSVLLNWTWKQVLPTAW